jgi:branched-chain amino acid transport system substrate-binding protein
MMKKYIVIPILAAIAVLGITAMVYTEYFSEENYKSYEIALLFPTTGDFATHGNENLIAATMAINDFNEYLDEVDADWRFDSWRSLNSETSPDISLEFVKGLYAQDIRIIIGPETSAEVSAIKPFADSNEILILSPTSTAPSLAVKDNIYRLAPDDTNQGHAITALLKKEGIKATILITRDDTWGNDLSASITSSFIENKIGDASYRILYNPTNPNYSETNNNISELVSLISESFSPDEIGIVVIGFGESTEFLKNANSIDELADLKWFGTDSNANERKIIEDSEALEFANKVDFTAVQFGSVSNDIHDDVESRLIEKLGSTPSTYAYSSYDAVWIIGQSILEANSADPKLLQNVIEKTASGYVGALGDVELNEAGDLKAANYDIWEIVDDTWQVTGYYDYLSGEIIK